MNYLFKYVNMNNMQKVSLQTKVLVAGLSSVILYILSEKILPNGELMDQGLGVGILLSTLVPFFILGLTNESYDKKKKLLLFSILFSLVLNAIAFSYNHSQGDFAEILILILVFILFSTVGYLLGRLMYFLWTKYRWLAIIIICCILVWGWFGLIPGTFF